MSGVNLQEQDGYAVVELDHPPLNILTIDLVREFRAVLAQVRESPVRGLLVRGVGKCFSAGADVKEHLPGKVEEMLPGFHDAIIDLLALDVPTVAYVHGATLGGGFELAIACDFVVAAEETRLGLPEITLGVFPPVAAALLPREIGARRALEIILTGEEIGLWDAIAWGIVNRVGPPESAEEFLGKIVRHPRPALVAAKRAARQAIAERIREAERIYLQELMSYPEPVEGLRGFLEKRRSK